MGVKADGRRDLPNGKNSVSALLKHNTNRKDG
jgi:hypothetical protein